MIMYNNNNNNNNNNLTFIMRLGNAMQTQWRRSLPIGKTHEQHLEAYCRGMYVTVCRLHVVCICDKYIHQVKK